MRSAATHEEKVFFKQLGERIASLRKEQGMTQAQLAELVSYSQQQVDTFEKGRCRMYATTLATFAKTLGVSVEDLLGTQGKNSKRGPTSKLQQQLERLARLPRNKQRFVSDMIEGYLKQAG